MKQSITIDQWQSISLGEQKKILDTLQHGGLPTIGDMIEFLNDNWKKDWSILFGRKVALIGKQMLPYSDWNKSEELADALWEAVKEVVEQKE